MPPSAPSPDSGDSAAAVVDGVRLAELTEALPVSRGSVFELVKALGIVTVKGPGPDGRGRVAWVSSADADRLADAARRVDRGEVRIADLAGGLVNKRTPQTAQTVPPAGSAPRPADSADSGPFPGPAGSRGASDPVRVGADHRGSRLDPGSEAGRLADHPRRDPRHPYRLELLAAGVCTLRRLRGLSRCWPASIGSGV
jgi:hypothetical protein